MLVPAATVSHLVDALDRALSHKASAGPGHLHSGDRSHGLAVSPGACHSPVPPQFPHVK